MILIVVSTGHFDPLIAECNRISSKYEFLGQIGNSTVEPVFPYFRTAPHAKIESCMKDAELVISHGGAGMTAMLNRLKKPNVIIPKQKRYGEANDLQVELARKWAELGMTVLCMDVEKIEESIEKCRQTKLKFPQFPSLGKYLVGQLGQSGQWGRLG